MTDYLPLLSRAVVTLDKSPEARRAVYDRARQALLAQLRSMNPPLAESEITRERLALEEAIRRVEMQSGKVEPVPKQAAAAAPAGPAAAPRAASAAAAPPPAAGGAPPVRPPASPPSAQRPRPSEPASGTKVLREAAAEAQQIGAATAAAARTARDTLPAAYELETTSEPVAETRARPGAPAKPGDELSAPLQPRAPKARSIDFAKADARKALQARLIVGGIVGVLLGIAVLIGYVQRDRILTSFGFGSTRTAIPDGPKVSDRVAADPQTQPQPQSRAPAQTQPGAQAPAAAVAQRAVLYEENPGAGSQQLQTFVGTAVWKTETVNPGPGRPPELGLRIEVEVPDRKMTVTITIRRNPDQTLPASHTVEVQFATPGDPFGGVANLPGIRAKTTETAQGAPLVGLVVRVMPGFFLVGLSAIEADREQNLSLLRERGWLDVPFVYNNGRRAVLVIEKGTPGDRAVNEAVAAWGG
jgi:hypothetical protein